MNYFNIKRGFEKSKSKGYSHVFIAIDVHDTIIPGTYTKNNDGKKFYPNAEEVLRNLSLNPNVKLILYSCSYRKPIDDFIAWLGSFGIKIFAYNENPDQRSTELCDFSTKFYFDILFEDKAGWVGETDWFIVEQELRSINQWIL